MRTTITPMKSVSILVAVVLVFAEAEWATDSDFAKAGDKALDCTFCHGYSCMLGGLFMAPDKACKSNYPSEGGQPAATAKLKTCGDKFALLFNAMDMANPHDASEMCVAVGKYFVCGEKGKDAKPKQKAKAP